MGCGLIWVMLVGMRKGVRPPTQWWSRRARANSHGGGRPTEESANMLRGHQDAGQDEEEGGVLHIYSRSSSSCSHALLLLCPAHPALEMDASSGAELRCGFSPLPLCLLPSNASWSHSAQYLYRFYTPAGQPTESSVAHSSPGLAIGAACSRCSARARNG